MVETADQEPAEAMAARLLLEACLSHHSEHHLWPSAAVLVAMVVTDYCSVKTAEMVVTVEMSLLWVTALVEMMAALEPILTAAVVPMVGHHRTVEVVPRPSVVTVAVEATVTTEPRPTVVVVMVEKVEKAGLAPAVMAVVVAMVMLTVEIRRALVVMAVMAAMAETELAGLEVMEERVVKVGAQARTARRAMGETVVPALAVMEVAVEMVVTESLQGTVAVRPLVEVEKVELVAQKATEAMGARMV